MTTPVLDSPELSAIRRYTDLLVAAFEQQLERTGAYTKPGMLAALNRAQVDATLSYTQELLARSIQR